MAPREALRGAIARQGAVSEQNYVGDGTVVVGKWAAALRRT